MVDHTFTLECDVTYASFSKVTLAVFWESDSPDSGVTLREEILPLSPGWFVSIPWNWTVGGEYGRSPYQKLKKSWISLSVVAVEMPETWTVAG